MARPARPGLFLAAFLGLAVACRCGTESLDSAEQSFTVRPQTLTFGRVLRGARVTQTLELLSTGRQGVTVTLESEGPFLVPAQVELPGAGSVNVEVTFTAPEGVHSGSLRAMALGQTQSVALGGEGVVPLDCQPSARCWIARFNVESGTCEETLAAPGSACIPESLCLEKGVCLGGECVGTARSCDDDNACTQDACSPTLGCVHTARSCPVPQNPCHRATCEPEEGCGEEALPDVSVCGTVDCSTAQLCFLGECQSVPTPDGLVCAPATPCQGPGVCQSGSCERPDPTVMTPEYSLQLPGTPSGEGAGLIREGNLGVFLELCGLDGGVGEACGLVSYTLNGFERFIAPHSGGTRHQLWSVSGTTVLLGREGGFELRSAANGMTLWETHASQFPLPVEASQGHPVLSPARVALGAGGEVWTSVGFSVDAARADGGVTQVTVPDVQRLLAWDRDGGVVRSLELRGLGEGGQVALAADGGTLFVSTPKGTLVRVLPWGDGGTPVQVERVAQDGGSGEVVLGPGLLVAGQRALYRRAQDALPTQVATLPLASDERLEPGGTLVGPKTGYGFLWRCAAGDGGTCARDEEALEVRGFSDGGMESFRHRVLPPGPLTSLSAAALVTGDGVCALTQAGLGGGVMGAQLQVFTPVGPLFSCELPQGTRVRGAAFPPGRMVVVAERDGGVVLESYALPGVSFETKGWPRPEGLGGTRQERPAP